jgi:RHS repeat-associated protein
VPDPVAGATYDAANRLLTFGSQTATADANGNLASLTDASGVTTYTWDARDRLVGLNAPGTAAAFTYDALGRRLTKTANGLTTQYAYDGLDVAQELGTAGPVDFLGTLNIDEPLVRGGSEFFLADALGSIVVLTDATGALSTEYTYEPFGRTLATGVASTNPFQFTGRENDATGLYYYRARYYHSGVQRFISEDPIGLRGGDVNFHAYVGNNPAGQRDPLGLQAVPIPGPAPIPVPFPPVFIPGTPENEAFTQATRNAIQAASAAIANIVTSLTKKCETARCLRVGLSRPLLNLDECGGRESSGLYSDTGCREHRKSRASGNTMMAAPLVRIDPEAILAPGLGSSPA